MVDPVTVRLAVLDAYHQTRGTRGGLMKMRRLVIERVKWRHDEWYQAWPLIAPYLALLIERTK